MKIKLEYFLSKRKVGLEKYCIFASINSYTGLKNNLNDLKVECPPPGDCTFLPYTESRENIQQWNVREKLTVTGIEYLKKTDIEKVSDVDEIDTVVVDTASLREKEKTEKPAAKEKTEKKTRKKTQSPAKPKTRRRGRPRKSGKSSG